MRHYLRVAGLDVGGASATVAAVIAAATAAAITAADTEVGDDMYSL